MSRQIRRHHEQRLKKVRESYWGDYGEFKRNDPKLAGHKLSAPKPQSSCMCCINPRILEGESRQELKNTESYKEMIKEHLENSSLL